MWLKEERITQYDAANLSEVWRDNRTSAIAFNRLTQLVQRGYTISILENLPGNTQREHIRPLECTASCNHIDGRLEAKQEQLAKLKCLEACLTTWLPEVNLV